MSQCTLRLWRSQLLFLRQRHRIRLQIFRSKMVWQRHIRLWLSQMGRFLSHLALWCLTQLARLHLMWAVLHKMAEISSPILSLMELSGLTEVTATPTPVFWMLRLFSNTTSKTLQGKCSTSSTTLLWELQLLSLLQHFKTLLRILSFTRDSLLASAIQQSILELSTKWSPHLHWATAVWVRGFQTICPTPRLLIMTLPRQITQPGKTWALQLHLPMMALLT